MTANSPGFKEALKAIAFNEGISLFGVADITGIKDTFLLDEHISAKTDKAVSIGYNLSALALETVADAPTQIYYFHYQRANILLDNVALKLAAFVQRNGFNALPVPASQLLDWEKQLGLLSHREVARLAGHGWYGKNNLLVNERYGSQVRYATILTDMPLETDSENKGSCGTCGACIGVCPAKAIGENSFNLEACALKLKEFTKIQKIGQMICGVCVKACHGKKP